ncbi:hypothetical protein WG66_004602 [Moniliophthora roreri]|nr:hypothetical protein WG66_004602 [Moniliophthora roreri]
MVNQTRCIKDSCSLSYVTDPIFMSAALLMKLWEAKQNWWVAMQDCLATQEVCKRSGICKFALTSGNPESVLLQTHKNSAGISFFNRAVSEQSQIAGSGCKSCIIVIQE